MKKDNKQKLFEVMSRLDKTFKTKINENLENDLESNNQDLLDFIVPEWAIHPLINADNSSLSDEDEIKINKFVDRIVNQYGNANFMLGDIHGKDNLGFKPYNDIDNLGSNTYRLYLKPSETNTSVAEINEANIKINPKYTHFALLKDSGKIIFGWDYNGYDPEDLKVGKYNYFIIDLNDLDFNPKTIAIYTKNSLIRKGIDPFDYNNWFKPESPTNLSENDDSKLGINLGALLDAEISMALRETDLSDNYQRNQFIDKIEKRLSTNDWISLSNGTTFEKTFTPTKK